MSIFLNLCRCEDRSSTGLGDVLRQGLMVAGVVVSAIALPGKPATALPVCWNQDFLEFQGHHYCLTALDYWTGAQRQAVSWGGNLVTINDAEEQAWLATNFGNNLFWIGLSYDRPNQVYQWASGEPVTFLNWAPGEPSQNAVGNEDYTGMNWGLSGWWNDFPQHSTWIFMGIAEIIPTLPQPPSSESPEQPPGVTPPPSSEDSQQPPSPPSHPVKSVPEPRLSGWFWLGLILGILKVRQLTSQITKNQR